jgi:signal transduction histidine kinase
MNRNWTYIITKTIVTLFMIGAAAISFTHIIEASEGLGVTSWQAWTVPFLVDGVAVLGLIGRSAKFAESTRRTGLLLTLAAGSLSLTCNILAGHNLGERLYGALVVAVFVGTEAYAAKMHAAPKPAPLPTVDEVAAAELRARRSAAAQKAAATRKANAGVAAKAAAKANREERRRIREAEAALAAS